MIIKFGIPLLAALAVGFGISTVCILTPKEQLSPAPNPPAVASLGSETIAGLGEFQLAGEPVAIATPISGIACKVHVIAGATVAVDDPLFTIDDRELQGDLLLRQSALATAEARLDRLLAGTRPEDLPPSRARVESASVAVRRAEAALARTERLQASKAISEEEHQTRLFALQQTNAELALARAELARLEAGTWSHDITIARREVEAARAGVERVRIDLKRLVVRAPVEGTIMHVNIRPGEFAQAGPLTTPLVQLGSAGPLQVRVQLDEEDASRMKSGAEAQGFVRGRDRRQISMKFVRIEPRVVPKTSLTGSTIERVDTRVLFVVYEVVGLPERVYSGQKLDVFIKP